MSEWLANKRDGADELLCMAAQRCHAKRKEASLKRASAEGEMVSLRTKCLPEHETIRGAAAQQTDYLKPLGRKLHSARSADALAKNSDVHQTLRL